MQTEVEAEQAKVDYTAAQRVYLQAFRTLAAIAGKGDLLVSPLQGDFEKTPELNAEQMVESVVANSPTVKRAQQEVAVAEARLKDANRESVPDLQLRAGEQYNGEQVSAKPVKPVGAQSFASVGINLPLWNRNQGNVEAAKVRFSGQIRKFYGNNSPCASRQLHWLSLMKAQGLRQTATKRNSSLAPREPMSFI